MLVAIKCKICGVEGEGAGYGTDFSLLFIKFTMQDKKAKETHQHPLPGEISEEQKKINEEAFKEAEKDFGNDPEISAHNENDDLDEGELARLGND